MWQLLNNINTSLFLCLRTIMPKQVISLISIWMVIATCSDQTKPTGAEEISAKTELADTAMER